MPKIPLIEHGLDAAGRNRENTLSMRRSWGASTFEILYFVVQRALRPEKLAQGFSYFRDSLEGRVRVDILRAIYKTCASTNLPFCEYLLHILLQPKLEITKNPDKFTSHAVKKELETQPHLKTKLENILLKGY